MTDSTLSFLHLRYISVMKNPQTTNIIDILKGLYQELSGYEPPEEDTEDFDIFLRNIQSSIRIREKTFDFTNLISDVVFTMMYIAIWANQTLNLDLDINLLARRKSLEGELTKLLIKSAIHDRFGIRGISLNNDSPDDSIETEKITKFFKYVLAVLTKNNRKILNNFEEWIKTNTSIDQYTKDRLTHIINIPFALVDSNNYVENPKPNGYKSLHAVLRVEMYSDVLPGAEFELQIRTNSMHQTAVNGNASHDKYKGRIDSKIQNVFKLDDFENVSIVGFSSYDSIDDDIDGIHHCKSLFNRRISKSLVIY